MSFTISLHDLVPVFIFAGLFLFLAYIGGYGHGYGVHRKMIKRNKLYARIKRLERNNGA